MNAYEKFYSTVGGLKAWDAFGNPIGLIYKGETTYNTRWGGLCSLFIWAIILWNFYIDCSKMKETYSMKTYTAYQDIQTRTDSAGEYNLDTKEVNLMGYVSMREFDEDTTIEVDSIVRIQFYYFKKEVDDSDPDNPDKRVIRKKFIPAIKCTDLYADQLNKDSNNFEQVMQVEFQKEYICPDRKQIQLLGDPQQISNADGQSLVLVVNSCKIAQSEDEKMRQEGEENPTYTDTECASDDVFDSQLQKVKVWTKIMTQDASDPYQVYHDNRYKWTYFTNRQKTGLLQNTVQS